MGLDNIERIARVLRVFPHDLLDENFQAGWLDVRVALNDKVIPLCDRLQVFYSDNPMPPATGAKADKAFFDELSGDTEPKK